MNSDTDRVAGLSVVIGGKCSGDFNIADRTGVSWSEG